MSRFIEVSNHVYKAIDADVVRYCDKKQVVISMIRSPRLKDNCYAVHDVSFEDGCSIFWGHYDLNFEEAVESFNTKSIR